MANKNYVLITQSLILIFETMRVKIKEMDCLNTYNCTAIFILHLTAHQARASLSLPAMIWQLIICCELFLHLVIHARLFFSSAIIFRRSSRHRKHLSLPISSVHLPHTNSHLWFSFWFWIHFLISSMYAVFIRIALEKKLCMNNNLMKNFTTNDKLSNHDSQG